MKARLPKGMGGGPQNMQSMIKQAQKMQEEMEKTQEELNEREYTTSAGGGMVKVVMNGRQEIRSLVIDPKALEGGDVEMLQDLVLSAVNEAVRITKADLEREMANLTGGIHLPGMF